MSVGDIDIDDLEKASRAELIEIIKMLLARVSELEAEVRAGKRQAAPFRKGKGKSNPKKPGRRRGEGKFTRRGAPEPGPADKVERISVTLEETRCPECGAEMEVGTETATTIDTPPEPVRSIKIFEVQVGRCPVCGKTVRGLHPDLAPDQFGATAHRVGPNVYGQALGQNYHSGIPLRKVPEVILTGTGISITQSALTQKAASLCREHAAGAKAYEGLCDELRQSPRVNTDDTGWRTGGQPSFLMGFFTPLLAVYQIRKRHRSQEVQEMLGEDFKGKLGTDRGRSYDAKVFDEIEQQKCLSHLLKNLGEVEKTKRGRARCFSRELKKTLRAALDIWRQYTSGEISHRAYRRRGNKLEKQLAHQLRERRLGDADNQRLLDGIGLQHDRGRVLLFLKDPEVEPTNNRAERGLRPAVIARKVSHCSKNETGAGIYEKMKSITATLKLRGQNVAKGLADLIRGKPVPAAR